MDGTEEKNVVAIVVLGQEVDTETGLECGPNTKKRIEKGIHSVYGARHKGKDAFLVFAAGKSTKGWRSPDTFATMMADYAGTIMRDDSDIDMLVNKRDAEVWTSWPEVDTAVDAAKRWYRENYSHQMKASWNDYSRLKIVFVADKKHLERIRLMARYKLRHEGLPPMDDRFVFSVDGLQQVAWCTEPFWGTAVADHSSPTAWWYEPLARGKFRFNAITRRISR